jgi:pyruvate,orthophosphate dikinase
MYPLYVCLLSVNCNCTGNESDAFIAQRILGKGIAASPGAAIGKVAFSTEQVQEYHAKQEACILVKAETSAEDVAALKVSLRLSDSSSVLTSELMIPCVLLPRTRSL